MLNTSCTSCKFAFYLIPLWLQLWLHTWVNVIGYYGMLLLIDVMDLLSLVLVAIAKMRCHMPMPTVSWIAADQHHFVRS
jgi:uncharacterized membrane protein